MKALERRIGQRRDATRAPIRGPEWRGGSGRPKDQISDSVVHNLLEPKNGLDFGVHLTPQFDGAQDLHAFSFSRHRNFGRMTDAAPGGMQRGILPEAGFVGENQRAAFVSGFFLRFG
jgi:hypothetical protein